MARVRYITPENRLARTLGGEGARFVEDMVQDAKGRVAALAPEIASFVAAEVRLILELGMQSEELVFADCREIADAALRVAEVAGAADRHAIGDAARGIRAMIEGLFRGGIWHSDALKLHVDALSLLSNGPRQSDEEEARILERLKRMRARIGVQD